MPAADPSATGIAPDSETEHRPVVHDQSMVDAAERELSGLIGEESLLTNTEIVVTRPRHRVEKRARIVWTLESMWTWAILFGLQLGWYYWGDQTMGYWNWVVLIVTTPVAVLGVLVAPWWRYIIARWDVSPTAICSRTGWWTIQFRVAPLNRLQTVYTKRNLFERIAGLATVQASIASSSGSVAIRGLKRDDAENLAKHLISIAEIGEGDAT